MTPSAADQRQRFPDGWTAPRTRAVVLALLPTLVLAGAPGHARAETTPAPDDADVHRPIKGVPIEWDPAWREADAWNWVVIGAFAATTLTSAIVKPRPTHWTRTLDHDEAVRDALRLPTRRQRRIARDTSDVLLTMTAAFPFAIDALAVAGWYRDSPDVAIEMAIMNLEVFAVTTAVQQFTSVMASRVRPYVRNCGGEIPAFTRDCTHHNKHRSFFSGHSANAFAGAAAACMHHIQMDLYGGGAVEAVPCVLGFAAATATATLRVVGDVHYFTDVLVGAGVGTLIGFGVPYLLHYAPWWDDGSPLEYEDEEVRLRLVPTPTGASVVGTF